MDHTATRNPAPERPVVDLKALQAELDQARNARLDAEAAGCEVEELISSVQHFRPGRGRLVSQMLTESCVVNALGGLLGLVIAALAVRALPTLIAADIPRLGSISIDARVLAVTGLLVVLSGLLSGVVPALHGSRPRLQAALADGARSSESVSESSTPTRPAARSARPTRRASTALVPAPSRRALPCTARWRRLPLADVRVKRWAGCGSTPSTRRRCGRARDRTCRP